MLLNDAPRKVALPFAENGEKNTIPEDSSPSPGFASMNDGFPPLTRQPVGSGGIPPQGLDMNGILYYLSALNKWQSAGANFIYDALFANDTDVNGYPKGAILLRADGAGFWLNQSDNNTTNPDTCGANWQPINNVGVTSKTLTSSDITLTNAEAAKDIIILSGTLTANVNLIVPNFVKSWIVANNTTGAFTVTVKTSSGTGGLVSQNTSRLFYGDGTNIYGVNPLASTQAQVNAGTDTSTFLTPKTFNDSQQLANKANKNGNSSELFNVADGVLPSNAVNKGQLDTVQNSIPTNLLLLNLVYPVNILVEFMIDIDPNTLWSGTTWIRYAEGKFKVGYLSGDSDFGTVGQMGGAKGHKMTNNNLIAHNHTVSSSAGVGTSTGGVDTVQQSVGSMTTTTTGQADPTPIPTLPPYVVTSIWRRVA